jgi:hypothetical protein
MERFKLVLEDFGYNSGAGWRVEKHPRFIADLTGNKVGDIVGFGDDGVCMSQSTMATARSRPQKRLPTTMVTTLVDGELKSIYASLLT